MKGEPWYATESKKRCRELGLDPNVIPSYRTCLTPQQLESRRKEYRDVLSVSRHFILKMFEQVKGVPFLCTITDKLGYLIETVGDPTIRNLVIQLGIQDGVHYNESDYGTNGIVLALRHNIPVQLVGTDHYHTFLHGAACYSVPLRWPNQDNIAGIISLMTLKKHHNPITIGLLNAVVDSIERELKRSIDQFECLP